MPRFFTHLVTKFAKVRRASPVWVLAFVVVFASPFVSKAEQSGEDGYGHTPAPAVASRPRVPVEEVLEIVWDVNDDHNQFGPRPNQIKNIFAIRGASAKTLLLSKATLTELREQKIIRSSKDHGADAVKELIVAAIQGRTASLPLRIRLYIDAHGFQCKDENKFGICTDVECGELGYQDFFAGLIGPKGLLPQNDSVRLDIFITSCFSRNAAYSFYRAYDGKQLEWLDVAPLPITSQKINLFTTSKGRKVTNFAHFWDTLELLSRLEQVRARKFSPEEFNEAMVALGRLKGEDDTGAEHWPLFTHRYSTYGPNSESTPGRSRVETVVGLAELGFANLDAAANFSYLSERVATALNEPHWTISSGDPDKEKLIELPEVFSDRLVDAFLSNPNSLKLAESLRHMKWAEFHASLLKRLLSGHGTQSAILLQAMVDSPTFYENSYSEQMEKFLLSNLSSPQPHEREHATRIIMRVVPEKYRSRFSAAISDLTLDSDPNVRRYAFVAAVDWEKIPVETILKKLGEEKESRIREEIISGLLTKPTSLHSYLSDKQRASTIISGLTDSSRSVQNTVIRQNADFASSPEAWAHFAGILETRTDTFDDVDWLTASKNLKAFKSAYALTESHQTFWRLYNFVSAVAYQRKGKMDLTRGAAVQLRKEMDDFLRSRKAIK
jgi:hypothetical protein